MLKAGEAAIWLLIALICFEESNQPYQVGSAATSGHVLSDLNKMSLFSKKYFGAILFNWKML